jgi:creatinine amidohydrolase
VYYELSLLSWPQVEALAPDAIGLLPFGATEQHGPHLPLFTDSLFARALARDVSDRLAADVLVAPVMHLGRSDHHLGFPGTFTLDPETYEAVVVAELEALRRLGVTRIGMFSGHGGNFISLGEIGARYVAEHPEMTVTAYTDLERFLDVMVQAGLETGVEAPATDVHAGALETSFALDLFPELVREHATTSGYTAGDDGWRQRLTSDGAHSVSDNGVFGDPRLANAETGRRVMDLLADELAAWLRRDLALEGAH